MNMGKCIANWKERIMMRNGKDWEEEVIKERGM